jgi:hypothetical protein
MEASNIVSWLLDSPWTGEISTEVYRKPTNSNLLQYNLTYECKNSIVNTHLHKAESLRSDINSYNTEVHLIEKVLMNNKYPKQLICNIKRKIEQKKNVAQQEQSKPDAVVVIPYFPNFCEKIIRFGRRTRLGQEQVFSM